MNLSLGSSKAAGCGRLRRSVYFPGSDHCPLQSVQVPLQFTHAPLQFTQLPEQSFHCPEHWDQEPSFLNHSPEVSVHNSAEESGRLLEESFLVMTVYQIAGKDAIRFEKTDLQGLPPAERNQQAFQQECAFLTPSGSRFF